MADIQSLGDFSEKALAELTQHIGNQPVDARRIAGLSSASELAYAQITTNVSVTATTETTATTIVTAPATTFDGSAVLIEFFTPEAPQNTSTQEMWWVLYEDGSSIGIMGHAKFPYNMLGGVYLQYRYTPSAGNHTYSIRAYKAGSGGSPAIDAGAGGLGNLVPSFIRITSA